MKISRICHNHELYARNHVEVDYFTKGVHARGRLESEIRVVTYLETNLEALSTEASTEDIMEAESASQSLIVVVVGKKLNVYLS